MSFYRKETFRPLRHATMLEMNEFGVLDYVRHHDPTTRTEIARALGLSPASVSRIVGRLLADGIVTERGVGRSAAGRPRTLISFRRDAGSVIAVDVGGTRCRAAIADLAGSVLWEQDRPTHGGIDPFRNLLESISAARTEAARVGMPVVALGIGVPGIVDRDGIVSDAPNVGWSSFPLARALADAIDVPFVLENDVNLAALAHAWRGDGQLVDDFVTITIGTGTGAAVVSNGRLVKGRHDAAGEIAYLVLRAEDLRSAVRGSPGSFERLVSGPGLARRATELLESSTTPSALRQREVTPEAVLEAAAAGDAVARPVVDEVLDLLAMAVVALVGIVDPEVVILEGAVGRSLFPYLEDLAGRVRASVPDAPRIVVSCLGRDGTMLGAVAAALQLARQHLGPTSLFESFGMAVVVDHRAAAESAPSDTLAEAHGIAARSGVEPRPRANAPAFATSSPGVGTSPGRGGSRDIVGGDAPGGAPGAGRNAGPAPEEAGQ